MKIIVDAFGGDNAPLEVLKGAAEAVQKLDDAYRLPIYLFYFQELSTGEIARALSLRPGTVRMRLSRGRDRLRELLKGDFFDE